MDEKLLLVAFLGFCAGYLFRIIIGSYKIFMEMGFFVDACADDCLKLIGETVYKTSYAEQLCYNVLKELDLEGSKLLKIQMEQQFEEWKIETINAFIKSYPKHYTWQLQYRNWDEAMAKLTHIYKREKLIDENSDQRLG